HRVEKCALAFRTVKLDGDVADGFNPVRVPGAKQFYFSTLDVDLEKIHRRSAGRFNGTRHIDSANQIRVWLQRRFHRRGPLAGCAALNFDVAVTAPDSRTNEPNTLSVPSEIPSTHFGVAGIRLDGYDVGPRKTTEKKAARIARVGPAVDDPFQIEVLERR